jgi:hypothetical protein
MDHLDRDGYALADLVFTDTFCDEVIAAIPEVSAGRGGVRHLLEHPAVARLFDNRRFRAMLEARLPGPLAAVKATLFDKTPDRNWLVVWHQDRMLAVRERLEADGFGPWRIKHGVLHVDAPQHVLEQIVAVRIHLDDCGAGNGPLRVIPRSHRLGKLGDEAIGELVAKSPQVELAVPRGAILLLRPLLVHASSAASSAEHRRVLHIELAPPDAIKPLRWNSAVLLERGERAEH